MTILVARSKSVKKRHDEDMISKIQITQINDEKSRKHFNKIFLSVDHALFLLFVNSLAF